MPDDEDVLRNPIFVVGAPRSGTAILADILRTSPGLAYLREPRLVWRYGNDGGSDLLEPRDARPEVVAHIRGTFARLVREQGGTRLIEKLPANALRLPFVQAVFPDARFVHIRRNGPDAVAAIRERWLEPRRRLSAPRQRDRVRRHLREASARQYLGYAGELLRKVAPRGRGAPVAYRPWGPRIPAMRELHRELDLLDLCALQWRLCVERAAYHGRQMPEDTYTEARLERLDDEVLARIARFCDLDERAAVDALHALYDPARMGGAGTRLTPDELDRVLVWTRPIESWLDAHPDGHRPSTAS